MPKLPKGWSKARAEHQRRQAESRRASAGMTPSDFDPAKLRKGTAVEMREHGLDARVAQRIAMDHLAKDPAYYDRHFVLNPASVGGVIRGVATVAGGVAGGFAAKKLYDATKG